MAELQPPEEVQINGNGAAAATTSVSTGALLSGGGASAPAAAAAAAAAAGFLPVTSSDAVGSKRQRRPSVRLGDLGGDQSLDSHSRRAAKPWKSSHHGGAGGSLSVENRTGRESSSTAAAAGSKPSSKTRPLVNFSETLESEERENHNHHHHHLEAAAIGSWRHKDSSVRRRGGGAGSTAAKRVRSNWVSTKLGDNADDKYSADGDGDDGGGENSDSRANSVDERDDLYGRRQQPRSQGFELVSGPSDTEARDWRGGEDGVRVWLNGLGLGRYAPVFEVHEVDDEVLPMLTLEDLKDMGINAVGSRRKMFCAIQKLGKGFS